MSYVEQKVVVIVLTTLNQNETSRPAVPRWASDPARTAFVSALRADDGFAFELPAVAAELERNWGNINAS
jgi:hypothetical protein